MRLLLGREPDLGMLAEQLAEERRGGLHGADDQEIGPDRRIGVETGHFRWFLAARSCVERRRGLALGSPRLVEARSRVVRGLTRSSSRNVHAGTGISRE